ncbi:Spy/CpxP family protein refolding chaperone [Sulfurisoma sediminicola]|uniref:Spy/CpxP family protein refolding chaperone n=1 Tax=Sulfurisoma sediminicola TaxID=1381557 RepID=UPI000EB56312|nr:Spy/CpxP family protein refolding chaperone [Sulfurisoma sediminicola]
MNSLHSKLRRGAMAFAVTAGLTTALVAVAQPATGPGTMGGGGMMGGGSMGGGPMGGGSMGGKMGGGNGGSIAQMQQMKLARLKADLAITPEQQPAWDEFAAKAAAQAKRLEAEGAPTKATGATREQMQQRRQKSLAAMNEPYVTLKKALTPKQCEVIDAARSAAEHEFD